MVPWPRWPGPPPPETKIIPTNRRPDFTTKRPSDPLYLPTSMPPLAVNKGPSRIREARLLPPSATARRVTSTFVWARITWLGFSLVPLIRVSAVRDGSAPPHMAAFSHAPLPPFHSTVVPALNAVALATARVTITLNDNNRIRFILRSVDGRSSPNRIRPTTSLAWYGLSWPVSRDRMLCSFPAKRQATGSAAS